VLVPGHTCFDARGYGCSVRVPTRCPPELRPRWSAIRDFQHGLKSTLEADELLRRRWYAVRSFSAIAGVVHVYKKVFVSTLEALPLRQDPLSSVITIGNTW
jgi:hypothetical protein